MIKEALGRLVEKNSLTEAEAQAAMAEIMEGSTTPAQLSAFLIALRMKGESLDEILGMFNTMYAKAVRVDARGPLLDTCGTGGDSSGTYNISTATALVAAAAGIRVAKHGNRAASSQCGSADVLEALGAKITLSAAQAVRCIDETGFVFLFAPAFHPAMRFAGPIRSEIGVRTIFNFLGPLTNPAAPTRRIFGVSRKDLASQVASILGRIGTEHAFVLYSEDGTDEITLGGRTHVHELRDGLVCELTWTAHDFGLPPAERAALAGGTKEQNAAIIQALFRGERGPKRDVLLANAAAALLVGDRAHSLKEGVALAAEVIDSGAAAATLEHYVKFSQSVQ